MCCPGKVCMLCVCLILVVITIGMLFGFGVFKNGFHKVKDTVHYSESYGGGGGGRPFLGYAPPPLF
ncbi:hypothetical protein MtrunA17_Chr5g0447181 [Medicago truncatula]|uniref:Transmembrane protein, putative n=1 Tax=Medicago truncatula TaxID=3880 RepID=G7K4U4_MEDTR|nr:uncharacterized protein LOC11442338 [Medicago truncatula]AET00864.1 transmembrane protein, putative [Medicago truncatula]AFK45021.1 unknown [Medicago truncatula]RHN58072.1 hypothetical protein MtrunA17_Chr5g0447181 [Medicago truncatula]